MPTGSKPRSRGTRPVPLRRRGVQRLPTGGLRVCVSDHERAALRSLPHALAPLILGEQHDDAAAEIRARLYPSAYDDPALEEEYRGLVGEELVQQRADALDTFTASLEQGTSRRGTWAVELDPEQAQAWLAVVNDARLVLAGVVGITSEQEWEQGPDPADPPSMLLWYLGWLEEQLVAAMMGSLPS